MKNPLPRRGRIGFELIGSTVRGLGMRGSDVRRDGLSATSGRKQIPSNHPLRRIRSVADEALKALDAQFAALYSEEGRPSIPPEHLLRALLLQAFYTIRSERLLMEQLNYNLSFRWFVGLSVDDPVWVPTVFSKNRDRLLEGDIAAFMDAVRTCRGSRRCCRTSISRWMVRLFKPGRRWPKVPPSEAWWKARGGQMKSFRRKDGNDEPPAPGRNGERNFHKEKRSNETHASTTDPDARLARKSNGEGAKLAFTGHLPMENRNGLVVDTRQSLTRSSRLYEPEISFGVALLGDERGAAMITTAAVRRSGAAQSDVRPIQ